MASRLPELFADATLARKIRRRLPYFFPLAEEESARAGKIEWPAFWRPCLISKKL